MSRSLIDSVANTTSHRDRDELDRAIVQLLLEFLEAEAVTLYRLIDDIGTRRIQRGASVARDARQPTAASVSDVSKLPAWDEVPAWRDCIAEQRAVIFTSPTCQSCVVFPITNERNVVGMLEVETKTGLQTREAALVEGILKIVRNHLALLDYGESDTLTGLRNRKTFEASFGKLRWTSGVVAKDEPSWLGILDIDKFKSINDQYGHLFGDEVLLLVAGILRQAFRGTDQLFRFGGEEFIIVLDRATTPGAQIAFNRVRSMVEEFRFPQVGKVTISLGYTRIDPQDAPGICIERADAALYYAKHHGRNNVQHFEALVAAGELKQKQSDSTDVELF